jgi:hypothetical protein
MTYWQLYLIEKASTLQVVLIIIFCISLFLCIVICCESEQFHKDFQVQCTNDHRCICAKFIYSSIAVCILSGVMLLVIPSTETLYRIVGIKYVVDHKNISQLPDNIAKYATQYLKIQAKKLLKEDGNA